MELELVDRKDLDDIDYLRREYEWLLLLNDDELSQKVMETNDVQNALIELLRFVDDVIALPIIATEAPDYAGDPNVENTDAWIDMN